MTPNEPQKSQKVDITRLKRRERRNIGKQVGGKVYGRNLPYTKFVKDQTTGKNQYISLEEFYALRKSELAAEKDVQSTHGKNPN